MFLRRQPRNRENVTLVARRRVHFRFFLAISLVAQLPPKRGVLVHKNSLASYQRCSHSVEPRAWRVLSNKVIWVLGHIQICRLWVRHSHCCMLFGINCFGIEMVLCDLYLKRSDLTKGLLFETFLITVWYKLCRCDHSVLELKSFHHQWIGRQNKNLQMHLGLSKLCMKKMHRMPDFLWLIDVAFITSWEIV